MDNNEPTCVYNNTNYKHRKITIRRTENGLQLRTLGSPKKQNPPLSERKYSHETFRVERLTIILEKEKKDEKTKTPFVHNITPPPAYQCLGTPPLPSAPILHPKTSLYHDKIQPYEIPKPSTKNQNI